MRNLLHTRKFDYRQLQEKRLRKGIRKGFGKIDIAYTILFFSFLFTAGIAYKQHPVQFPLAHADTVVYISPLARLEVTPTATPTLPTPTPQYDSQQQQIIGYIKSTFGEYTERAMQLLSCENSSLNPVAINTAGNYPVGSEDIGVFQINNYWNDIGNVDLLEDPQVNVAVAWKKFKDSGYSFNQWTCGRELGI